jgi:hypothetical protein
LTPLPTGAFTPIRDITTAEKWTMLATEVSLGPTGTAQTITSQPATSGVTYYEIKQGALSPNEYWTVNIGFYCTQAAQANAVALTVGGFTTQVDPSAGAGTNDGVLGDHVSVGKFSTQAEATTSATQFA